MESMVLIFTYSEDPHAEAVINHLDSLNIGYVRIDTDIYPFQEKIIIQNTDHSFIDWKLEWKGEFVIDKNNLKSIWCRRIVDPKKPTHFTNDIHRFVSFERTEAIYSIINDFSGLILCNPPDVQKAQNKVLQLKAAKICGLETPKTLVTSVYDAVKTFWKKHDKNIAYKPQKTALFQYNGQELVTYTRKLSDEALENIAAIEVTPGMYQEYIEKKIELRVTVVGCEIFCCAMETQFVAQTKIDYRKYDFENVKHYSFNLPVEIEKKILELLSYFKLSFASIDLILTPDNRYVFLDLNPNGQWLWTEKLADINISESIAHFLGK